MPLDPCWLSIAEEPFEAIWPCVGGLAEEHAREVEPEGPRKFLLDTVRMVQGNRGGTIRIFTARINGVLVGYVTWNIQWDVESAGLLIATQGAWFVLRHPEVPFRTAGKLFEDSLEALRASGVKCVFPHHRTRGRGKGLARYFASLGATREQETYQLWIGD